MRTKNIVLAAGAALCAIFAGSSRAELIELTNGKVLQGKVNEGRSGDDGLAPGDYRACQGHRIRVLSGNGTGARPETAPPITPHRSRQAGSLG